MFKIQNGLVTFILILFAAQQSYACKCPAMAPLTIVECRKFDVIAQCQVDSLGACNGKSIAFVHTIQMYKGEVPNNWNFVFDCSSSCQLSIEKGDTWLVYAKSNDEQQLELGFCDRNRKKFSKVEEDYFLVNTGLTFQEELDYLVKNIGLKQAPNEENGKQKIDITQRENEQTSGGNKIWLLIASLAFFLIFYFFVQNKIS